MFTKVNSCANTGLNCELIEIETDQIRTDQTKFVIVGLPDTAIQEARERVRLAIKNSGFKTPRYKTIVNLAPADLRKEGPAYDLGIALSVLIATNQIVCQIESSIFVGELALNGNVRQTNGILPITIFAKEKGIKNLFIPKDNADEASLISGLNIYAVESLSDVVLHLQGTKPLTTVKPRLNINLEIEAPSEIDMSFVHGQEQAKRALEIAASGAHNVLMSGPPGSGKTLLARSLASILPAMSEEEIIEVTKIYSVAGLLPKDKAIIRRRPFRSPHHTSSGVALVGGGRIPSPGEISLAHRGILFLDEFPEFTRQVLENLRQPLEDGTVSISRAHGTLSFPANFTLIASQNPCPCGYASDPEKNCTCTTNQILNYQKKISGPILDRIDLHIEVPRINFEKMQSTAQNESSATIRQRIEKALEIQAQRFMQTDLKYNNEMRAQDVKKYCPLDQPSIDLLRSAMNQLHLSARAYHRILKVSRTIADLEQAEKISSKHIAEALQYRSLS
ncbi:YifB family Mg chelatase-like AAA ATPase [Candidatus Falkowbacteria bacterium]|jgi:magnesium chelatase family protein|nr:YifB family Mg chelatase-like AAA ATPase [Candidatus Falkowbacteria bacterium]MBT5502936.1 YifB family Mg chelatase-like AAA ATPase [Candidatus Falkowbacteria bacterium]MBT6574220.1 YifB family Mg chelatase-like AAA ATPase [Candidatus Falkowbacteria bacterium]MBT7348632.1 YifB family Mg chelatase-like AAA ATPase [Candidatus Falkowbacteria bacterium]MBT7500423.1 YifB family Mg chelatase-like AAA ATPase [Candidatus Falkowbacteria bacterium]